MKGDINLNDLVKTIFIIVISSGISTLLLNQLYKANKKLFSFTNKIPEKWKGQMLVKWIVLFFLMIIMSILVVIVGLNDTISKVIIGFIISLTDFVFGKPKKIDK